MPNSDGTENALEDLAAAGFAVFLFDIRERGLDLDKISERDRKLMSIAFKAGVACGVDATLPDAENAAAAHSSRTPTHG